MLPIPTNLNWLRLAALALLPVLIVLAGRWLVLHLVETGREQQRHLQAVEAASAAVLRDVRSAQASQAASQATFAAQRIDAAASAIDQEIGHVPLAIVPPRSCAGAVRRLPAGQPLAARPASASADPRPGHTGGTEVGGAGGDVRLTAGAVRLWDDALAAGRDRHVPSVPCLAAGAAGAACAAGVDPATAAGLGADVEAGVSPDARPTGYALTDAWRNHTTNAASCARDRARLEQLTTLLRPYAASQEQ